VTPGGMAWGQPDASAEFPPQFMAWPSHGHLTHHTPGVQLTQWNAVFKDKTGEDHSFTMPGTNPANLAATTTFSVLVIAVKMVYGKNNGNMTFNPVTDVGPNGFPVALDTLQSPLFNADVDFVQGGTDVGTTQYIDAFQRANFWYSVHLNGGGYHVLFNPTFENKEITITVSPSQGKVIANPYGPGKVGTMSSQAFDAKLQSVINSGTIPGLNPGTLPFFISDNIFLIPNGGKCCVGGYHSTIGAQPGGQTYSYATYLTHAGSFCQDVSCQSHELGEWMDDPFVDNGVNCQDNGIMEVGDPLEGGPNHGDYPYLIDGAFTYNLQSLVFIGYFGGNPGTSLHHWLAFQDDMNHVCPGQ